MNNLSQIKKEIEAEFDKNIAPTITEYGGISSDIELENDIKSFISKSLDQVVHAVIESVRMKKKERYIMKDEHGSIRRTDTEEELKSYNQAIDELNTKLSLLEQQLK